MQVNLVGRVHVALDGPAKDAILQLFSEPFKFLGRKPATVLDPPQIWQGPLSFRRVEGSGLMRQVAASSGPR